MGYPFSILMANRFWKILADLAEKSSKMERGDKTKAVKRDMKYEEVGNGVQNLGLEIERKGKSALDTHIRINKYTDIILLLKSPELKRILYLVIQPLIVLRDHYKIYSTKRNKASALIKLNLKRV